MERVKQLGRDIWTLVGPELVFAGAPMHTRMTVVRLQDGRLWIHSPIELDAYVRNFVAELDTEVAALIAPNKFHHLYAASWREAYPDAMVFAETSLKEKVPELADALDITDTPPGLYAEDIDQLLFTGNRMFTEAVFFHKASRTAIFTDLLMNFRTDRAPLLPRLFFKFEGVVYPEGGLPRLYRWLTRDKAAARACLDRLLAWVPEQLVFSHGEPFADDAVTVLRREFSYLLN